MNRLAIVTGSQFPHQDNDEAKLIEALRGLDVHADVQAWNNPDVEWNSYDVAVVRSTWDYSTAVVSFCDWAKQISRETRLLNPADVLEWNADKHYLGELAAAGLPVVPTAYVETVDEWEIPDYPEYVVKPVVSGGGRNSGRYRRGRDDDRATNLVRDVLRPGCKVLQTTLSEGRTMMVQPLVPSVEVIGEKSLLFLGGRISHAIRKGQVLASGGGKTPLAGTWENISPASWDADELALAEAVLERVPGGPERLAYARVDVVRDTAGAPMLLELELLEPSLFLYTAPESYGRFASVLASLSCGDRESRRA